MPGRAVHSDRAAAPKDIDEAAIAIWSHLVNDPQQLTFAAHPRDKAVQDAPSLKGKASSDCSIRVLLPQVRFPCSGAAESWSRLRRQSKRRNIRIDHSQWEHPLRRIRFTSFEDLFR